MYNDPDKQNRPARPEETGGEWTKEEPGRKSPKESSFDFDAFLETDNLEDQVKDALNGKSGPEKTARRSAGSTARRSGAGEKGRHEAPSPEPEEDEVFPGDPPTQRFTNQETYIPPQQEQTWQDPSRAQQPVRPPVQQPVRPPMQTNVPPPRPKVVVADPAPRQVVVTPETRYSEPEPKKKGMGKGMKFLIALLLSIVVLLAVAAVMTTLLPSGGETPSPAPSPTDYLFGGMPTRPPAVPTVPPAPTAPPEPTAAPEPTPPAVTYYTITVTAGSGGSVSPTGMVDVEEGGSATFTISPYEGYVLGQLLIDGSAVPLTDSYTFTDVRQSHTVYAVFQAAAPTEPPATDVPVIPDVPMETEPPVVPEQPEQPMQPDVPPAVEG